MRITVEHFLNHVLSNHSSLTLLSEHSSLRKFYRTEKDGINYIVMDTPNHGNAELFSQIATALAQAGVNVPDIIEDDLNNGYLLISDFGDHHLQHFAMINPQHWLPICLDNLFDFQVRGGQHVLELPLHDNTQLLRELSLFPEWFVTELLKEKLSSEEETELNTLNRLLIDNALNQPQVWIHRDYHSRNLMKVGDDNLGIIGFQNAMFGAVTYDLASILKDSYVRYPKQVVHEQLEKYYIRLVGHDKYFQGFDQFERNVDLMGLQRHLKIIGTAARQSVRDGQHANLNHLPLVFDYIFDVVAKYPELNACAKVFEPLAEKFEHAILS